jgi:hypothetical protein
VAFDTAGNLFIGDTGQDNLNAGPSSHPAFIVEVPVGGGPAFKVNTGAVQLWFPGSIAVDPYTGDLLVGDDGFSNQTDGTGGSKVVRIPAGGGSAIDIPEFDGTNPAGIVFDPADEYYVLDGTTNQITLVPPVGNPYTLPLRNGKLINTPDALAITNGGQSFVVANSASTSTSGSNNLIYLNGMASTLAFGGVPVGQEKSLVGFINNIGTKFMFLSTPFFTATGNTGDFSYNDSTCYDGLGFQPAAICVLFAHFTPQATGARKATFTFHTDGYLPNSSVQTLRGAGR